MSRRPPHLILGVGGGIAAYKSVYLLRQMKQKGWRVRVILTPTAKHFVGPLTFDALADGCDWEMITSEQRWVNHVERAEWADLLVIAPATAHLIARMVHGMADNLLLLTYLSFTGPVFVAPAMDAGMYRHPAVQANLKKLAERPHHHVLPVDEGALASGLEGPGRMWEPDRIIEYVERHGVGL